MTVKMATRGEPRKRRAHECQQRRTEILEAAECVFASKGYACASMEEVAREADLAVGTLYNFFKNKEALYVEILHQKSDLIGMKLDAVFRLDVRPLERIEKLFHARIDIFWENPRFFRLFYHHTNNTLCDPRQGMTDDIRARYEAMLDRITQVFREGVDAQEFIAVEPDLLSLSFEGIIRSYLARLSRYEEGERNPQEESTLLSIFLDGARHKNDSQA